MKSKRTAITTADEEYVATSEEGEAHVRHPFAIKRVLHPPYWYMLLNSILGQNHFRQCIGKRLENCMKL
jgi:hypothetical protein